MARPTKKNPFPANGTLSLYSKPRDAVPTLETSQLARAWGLAEDYLSTEIGQGVVVYGPPGSGKTHLIYYLQQRVKPQPEGGPFGPRQLYAKANASDFLEVYQDLAKNLGLRLLRGLNASFLGRAASREQSRDERAILENLSSGEHTASDEENRFEAILERIKGSGPKEADNYLSDLFITQERALGGRSGEVYDLTLSSPGTIRVDDFKRAIYYLGHSDERLRKTAFHWLMATDPIPPGTDFRRIGVSGPIADADEALSALGLLVRLFEYAEVPLLVYIDEIENLLPKSSPEIAAANIERLKRVVDSFSGGKAFLILSGLDGARAQFTDALNSRLSSQINMGKMSRDVARRLVAVHLKGGTEPIDDERPLDQADLEPFTTDAVDEILRLRGSSMRYFLSTCNRVYAQLTGREPAIKDTGTIDRTFVQEAVRRKTPQRVFTLEAVRSEIEDVLRLQRLRFSGPVTLGDGHVLDFAIGDEDSPSVAVKVSEALFYVDEARNALSIIEAREELVARYPGTRFIVVVMGYISPEVEDYLSRGADGYIVYETVDDDDPDNEAPFGEKLAQVLTESIEPKGPDDSASVPEGMRAELENVKEGLSQLFDSRQEEADRLESTMKELFSAEARRQETFASSQSRQEWRAWLNDDEERWQRRKADLKNSAELERKRRQEDGGQLRLRIFLLRAAPFLLGVLGVFVASWMVTSFFKELSAADFLYEGRWPISLIVTVLFAVGLYFGFLHKKAFPLGILQTIEIGRFRDDLGELALRANTKTSPPRRPLRALLEDPNPVVRYYVALLWQSNREWARSDVDWTGKAVSETWEPLYLRYLQLGADDKGSTWTSNILERILEVNPDDPRIVPTMSFMADYAPGIEITRAASFARRSRYGNVLAHATFEGLTPAGSIPLDGPGDMNPLLEFAVQYVEPGSHERTPVLAQMFRESGLVEADALGSGLDSDLSRDDLERIIRELSPHDEQGLATFQGISRSGFYLRLYRFFSEIQWRLDRDEIRLGTQPASPV